MRKAKEWLAPSFVDISPVFRGLNAEQAAMRNRRRRKRVRPRRPGTPRPPVRSKWPSVKALVRSYLQVHPCVDCGETDLDVLEFDHREPAKKKYLVGRAPNPRAAVREIAKCDVRCANCHRKRHARDRRAAKCNT